MRILSMKYCTDCGTKRNLFDRLTATDDELCERCYFNYIELMRRSITGQGEKKDGRFYQQETRLL